MTTFDRVLADSTTMLRREFIHARRYPSLTFIVAAIPIVIYLLFVYVFGATLGDGLGGDGGREAYIAYVTPGILMMGIAGSATSTAVSMSMDMTQGIIARFRTMSIPRSAVVAGHVIGSVAQTMLMLLAVFGVAVLTGFRPTTAPIAWLGAFGMLALAAIAVTWLSVALGLSARSVETASNLPMPLILLPFFGSGFVPAETLPGPVAWFAEYQPFTPITETVRGLLLGTPIGWSAALAVGWCAFISLGGYVWAMRLYNRDPIRPLAA
jgi:ABC-2 type transport system permease protein